MFYIHGLAECKLAVLSFIISGYRFDIVIEWIARSTSHGCNNYGFKYDGEQIRINYNHSSMKFRGIGE